MQIEGHILYFIGIVVYWWKKLGGSRCDKVDKVNNPMHDFLLKESYVISFRQVAARILGKTI